MMRKIILVASLLVLALTALTGCQKSEPVEVISSDGRMKMNLQSGALPGGVNASDISIISESSLDKNIVAFYQLGPDGTSLNKPAEIEINFDMEKENLWVEKGKSFNVPFVNHIHSGDSKDGEEINADVDIDMSKNLMSIRLKVDSFSTITVSRSSPLLVTLSITPPQDEFNVGESFNAEVVFSANPEPPEFIYEALVIGDGVWDMDVEFIGEFIDILHGKFDNNSFLAPQEVDSVPDQASISVASGETLAYQSSFTCVEESREGMEIGGEELGGLQYFVNLVMDAREYYTDTKAEEGETPEMKTEDKRYRATIFLHLVVHCRENNVDVDMLIYEDQQFPLVQFRGAQPDLCGDVHYHPVGNQIAYSREKQAVPDPIPQACGFGVVETTPIEIVSIPFFEAEELSDFLVANGKPPLPLP